MLSVIIFLCNNLFTSPLLRFESKDDIFRIVMPFLPRNPVILEAGAYDGADTILLKRHFGRNSTIHAFEPIPELYKRIAVKTHKYPYIYTYMLALGDFIGQSIFHISEINNATSASSSLLPPKDHCIHAPEVAFTKELEVSVTTIDQWAKDNKVGFIDFMWLDMQGYELNALKAAPNLLKTVRAILTEVEFVEAYKGQYLYHDVKNFLESEGFTLIAVNFDIDNPRWFGDALFVRTQ